MQVPAPFEYERATSVDHALSLLTERGAEARIVAGGHSLLPMMKLRLAAAGAAHRHQRPDRSRLHPGRRRRDRDRRDDPPRRVCSLRRRWPSTTRSSRDAERVDRRPDRAQPRDRSAARCARPTRPRTSRRGVGAAGDGGHRVGAGRRDGRRPRVPPRPVRDGGRRPAEMLAEVRVPIRPGAGSAYEKVERRAGDWAVAAGRRFVWLDGDTIADVGIGLTAVGRRRTSAAPEAEDVLRGQRPPTRDIAAAAAGSPRRLPAARPTSAARSTTSATWPAS